MGKVDVRKVMVDRDAIALPRGKPKLEIIITHYKEPWEIGKPAFDMLALQRGVGMDDFRVILVNDGEQYHIDDRLLAGYPYEIRQIDIPHGGISAARNAGMDAAVAEWINFCDFDDSYTNLYAMRDIISLLPAEDYDVLWCHMMTDDLGVGMNHLIEVPLRSIWVFCHGKFYRRQWLKAMDIRFDLSLNFQEDSLFNALVVARAWYKRIGEIKCMFPPYVWKRTEGSVTTSKGHEDPAVWGHFMRNWKLCDYYKIHLPEERLKDLVVRCCFDTYYMCNGCRLSDGMRQRIAEQFKEFLKAYGQYYRRPDEDTLEKIADVSWDELEEARFLKKVDFETVTKWKEGA